MPRFRLSESDIWPGCREIEIEGEVDLAVSEVLRAALARAAADCRHVLLGFEACEFIDASGLAALVAGRRELGRQSRQLLLYGVGGQVRRVLALTGLAEDGLLVGGREDAADPDALIAPLNLALGSGDETVRSGSFRVSVAGAGLRPVKSGTWGA
jgi:anti-anti-sigma factor